MDVQYLNKIGEHTDHVLFVDTARRDKQQWPTSAEFAVDLPNPMRYVTAIEALDVSVPVTMYNVDTHNNTLRLVQRSGGNPVFLHEDLMPAVRDALGVRSIREAWAARAAGEDLTLLLAPEGEGPPPRAALAAAKLLVLPTHARFATLFRRPLGPPLRMGAEARERFERLGLPAWAPVLDGSTPSPPPTPQTHAMVDGHYVCLLDSELAMVAAAQLDAVDPGWGEAFYTDWGGPGGAMRLLSLAAVFTADDPAAETSIMRFFAYPEHLLALRTVVVEPGNYDVDAFVTALEAALNEDRGATAAVIVDTPSSVFPRSGGEFLNYDRRVVLRCKLAFFIDCSVSTLGDTLGLSTLARRARAGYLHLGQAAPARGGGAGSTSGTWDHVYCAAPNLQLLNDTENSFHLTPDGIVYLMGPRLLVVRCLELEASSPLAHASSFNGSLGVVKLYDQTISHLRFDFVKSRRLRFHPIGKLTRLTLRFELPDGSLYDFKGVDFHLMINISTLQPALSTLTVPERFPLNPDYNPENAGRPTARPARERAPLSPAEVERRFAAARASDVEEGSARRNARAANDPVPSEESDDYYTTSDSEAEPDDPRACGSSAWRTR